MRVESKKGNEDRWQTWRPVPMLAYRDAMLKGQLSQIIQLARKARPHWGEAALAVVYAQSAFGMKRHLETRHWKELAQSLGPLTREAIEWKDSSYKALGASGFWMKPKSFEEMDSLVKVTFSEEPLAQKTIARQAAIRFPDELIAHYLNTGDRFWLPLAILYGWQDMKRSISVEDLRSAVKNSEELQFVCLWKRDPQLIHQLVMPLRETWGSDCFGLHNAANYFFQSVDDVDSALYHARMAALSKLRLWVLSRKLMQLGRKMFAQSTLQIGP